MTTNTITGLGYIDAAHIEDVIGIDDTSDLSGVGGVPKTKKVGLEQIREYGITGYGIPLQHFQSKLHQLKKGTISKVRIFCIGDSTTVGQSDATDQWGNSWPANLTKLFNANGFNATNAAFYGNGNGHNADTYNNARFTQGSSWSTSGITGLGGNYFTATTTTNALSFKPTEYWDTAIQTYLIASGAGTFSTDIDGSGTTNTNANGSTGLAKVTITASSPGIHTLNWKYVSGTAAYAPGVECYNSQLNQVMIVNCGWGGVTTTGIAAGTGAFDPIQSLQFQAADLYIFGTVINDWLGTISLSALATSVQALITAARVSGDCVWMLSVPSGITNTPLATQVTYCNAIRAVCQANNVPIIDIFDRYQSFEISNPLGMYYPTNSIHPSVAGYDLIAKTVFDTLNVKGYTPLIQAVVDGTTAKSSTIGETITSTVAIGSAVSLTSPSASNITSITLQPGDYDIWGNIGFIAATGTIPTVITGSISTTTGTQATSPNGGAYAQIAVTLGTASTNILPIGTMNVNPTVPTTYYLVGSATFTVSTLTAYGSITARRRR